MGEALTHCSARPDASPSCERLALVGEETVRAHVSLHSVDRGSIPIAASARAGCLLTQECEERSSLAAPNELVCWREALEHSPASRPAEARPSLEETQLRALACCNRASYALSCVHLKLRVLLRYDSPELTVSIKRFVQAKLKWESLSSADGQAAPCPPAGAPRVLGDVFLACIGALVLDGKRTQAEKLIEEHRERCLGFEKGLEGSSLIKQRNVAEANLSEVATLMSIIVKHAGAAINGAALAPPPPSTWPTQKEEEEAAAKSLQFQEKASGYNDACIILADAGKDFMCSYGGVSPRAAMLHKGRPPVEFEELDTTGHAAPTAERSQTEDPIGRKWCDYCEMWLNGPIQYADHVIGKKHRKNHGNAERYQKKKSGTASESGAPTKDFPHQ